MKQNILSKMKLLIALLISLPFFIQGFLVLYSHGTKALLGGTLTILAGLALGWLYAWFVDNMVKSTVVKACALIKASKENPDLPMDFLPPPLQSEISMLIKDFHTVSQLHQTVLEAVEAAILSTDDKGTIIFANGKAKQLFAPGNHDTLIGKHYTEVSSPTLTIYDSPFNLGKISDALHYGIVYEQIELEGQHADDRCIVQITTKILTNAMDKPMGVMMIINDCTAQRLFEEQAQRNECLSMVGEMAAGVAHEIRNPLQSIKGFVQLLQEKYADHKDLTVYTDIVESEIDRMNMIIKHFLQLSKPADTSLDYHNLEQICRDVVLLIKSEAALTDTVIEEEYLGPIPLILMDAAQIKQVLFNLFSNAFAAMPNGGTISIKVRYDYHVDEACVQISDTGVGMDNETLKKIGRPFFTTKASGTGLGMSVCHRIVNDHGGRMEIASALGKGTTITVCLPGLGGFPDNPGRKTN